jgi:hypothetical protein
MVFLLSLSTTDASRSVYSDEPICGVDYQKYWGRYNKYWAAKGGKQM